LIKNHLINIGASLVSSVEFTHHILLKDCEQMIKYQKGTI